MKNKIIFALLFGILINCYIPTALTEELNNTSVYHNYQTIGLKAAEQEYKKLIKKNSKDEAAYIDMVYVYYQEEQPENIIKVGMEGTKKIPNAYVLYNFMGIAYKSLKNIDGAIWAYSKSIDVYPSEPPYYNRGKIWFENKDYNRAITDFTKALEYLNKDKPADEKIAQERFFDLYAYRGYSYMGLEDYGKAIADFDMAVQIKKTNPYVYFNRSRAKVLKLTKMEIKNKNSETEATNLIKSAVEDLELTLKYARESNNSELYNTAIDTKYFLYDAFGRKK